MNHATRPPDIRLNRHMFHGYQAPDTPVERNDEHPPEQWDELRAPIKPDDDRLMPHTRGFMARRFFGDIEDRKII